MAGEARVQTEYVSGIAIAEDGFARTVKRVFGNPAASGNNQIVAAVTGRKIRVLAASLLAVLANTATFRDGTVAISADVALAANGGMVLPFNPHGWFETGVGQPLNLGLTAAAAVGVNVVYIEV
jgi:hypothetical protein